MNFTKNLSSFYDNLWTLRDKRVDNWLMMNSPWPTVSLCLGYIYVSTIFGPAVMKNRPAFNLKKTIMVYNLFQVIFSAYVFYEACVAGWLTGYNWLCQDIDRDTHPDSKGNYLFSFLPAFFYL